MFRGLVDSHLGERDGIIRELRTPQNHGQKGAVSDAVKGEQGKGTSKASKAEDKRKGKNKAASSKEHACAKASLSKELATI